MSNERLRLKRDGDRSNSYPHLAISPMPTNLNCVSLSRTRHWREEVHSFYVRRRNLEVQSLLGCGRAASS